MTFANVKQFRRRLEPLFEEDTDGEDDSDEEDDNDDDEDNIDGGNLYKVGCKLKNEKNNQKPKNSKILLKVSFKYLEKLMQNVI